MQTCGEDHVNEAKANEESSRQEEVGLPDHQHHHVHQHSCAKHHAAHRHTCHQHTHTHTHIKTCSSEVLKTGLLCLLVPAAHREAQKSFAVFEDMLCRAFLLSETLSTKKRSDKNILAVIEEEHESEVYWASL